MPSPEAKQWVKPVSEQHPVATFVALAFLISWGGVYAVTLPTGIPGTHEDVDRLFGIVFAPMLAGPIVSALVMSVLLGGWSAPRNLLRGLLVWRAKPVEYAAAILLIPACASAVLLALSVVSPAYTPGMLGGNAGFAFFAMALGGGFLIGVIEETGWTGFAIARVARSHALLPLGIGFGLVHGIWHLLVTVWAEGADFGLVLVPYFVTAWILALVAMRILIVWVYDRTGSTLLAAAAHCSHTGWLFLVWPPETTPWQDVIWTAAFASLGLIAVVTLVNLTRKDV